MVYIIVGLIVIGLAVALLKTVITFLLDIAGVVTESFSKVFGKAAAIVICILSIIAFFAFSWAGMFAVVAGGLLLALLIGQIAKAGRHIKKTVEEHDQRVNETMREHDMAEKEKALINKKAALINENTRLKKEMQENETALQNELDRNCRWLGYMNEQMWKKKLPNYAGKKYTKLFGEITQNFAKQMERQNITQNDDWFKPFLEFIASHSGGTTITKMLNEVECPQFKITHNTPNFQLLKERLILETKRKNRDVPPTLERREQVEASIQEPFFVLSSYGKKLYGLNNESAQQKESLKEEFDISKL